MRPFWASCLLGFSVSAALAQPPDSLWSRTFGGSETDFLTSAQLTSEGGYVMAGHTWSFGAGLADFWLIEIDANGDSLWSRTFGGSGWDYCYAARQTTDGGYILAGSTTSFGVGTPSNYPNVWLVKTNSNGDSLWSRTYGGTGFDECRSVVQTGDGGYLLAGLTGSLMAQEILMAGS